MLTIFNRKEFMVTYSMKEQIEVCNLLRNQNIEYMVKIVNRTSASSLVASRRATTFTFGENHDLDCEYIIYVNKKNYDEAKYFMR